jgi:AraC-like DNA-binding protein
MEIPWEIRYNAAQGKRRNLKNLEAKLPPSTGPIFRHFVPRKPLSDFVELFWYWNHTPESTKERVLPAGTVEFVIRLKKDHTAVFLAKDIHKAKNLSGSTITGPQSEFFVLDKSQQDELIGVHFKPGGAYPFFGAPTDKFLNSHISLDDVWRGAAESFRSQLLEASTVNEKFQVLELRLLERLANSSVRHPAVAFALQELQRSSAPSLAAIATTANLSSKRLTQLFSREVGVTPKLFARLQRFQNCLKRIEKRQSIDWLEIALGSGYYDQAHFNHDFLEFTGMNPSSYLKKKTAQLGHIQL